MTIFLFLSLGTVGAVSDDIGTIDSDFNDLTINDNENVKHFDIEEKISLDKNNNYTYVDEDSVRNDDDPWVDNFEEDSKDDIHFGDDEISIDNPQPHDEISSSKLGTVLDVNGFSKYYLNATQLTGFLKDSNKKPLSNKIVSIYFSNKVYNRTTDNLGAFGLGVNLKPGNYSFTIKFAGDSKYLSSTKTISVKVFTMPTSIEASNLVKYYLNGSHLKGRLLDGNNNPLKNKTVHLAIASGNYNKTTDNNGYFTQAINFNPRVCNATISFSEKGYKSSSRTVTVTVKNMPTSISSSNVNKFYKNGTQWTARLLDANGNPLSNKKLIFTVCGDSYNKTTDSNGYAIQNINFNPRYVNGTVSFAENYYMSSSKTVAINVFPHNVYFANASDNILSGSKFYFRLLNDGKSFPNQKVTLNLNGEVSNITTDNNGIGFVTVNLDAGYWPVSLYYKGNDYNSSAEGHGYLTVRYDSDNYSINNIIAAASVLNKHIHTNHTMPGSIKLNNQNISIYEFSYLMAKAIKNIHENNTGDIRLPYIYKGSNSKTSFFEDLSVYTYMTLIDNIISFTEANSYLPSNVSISNNIIGLKDYTFSFSKILSFYNSSNILPDYSLNDFKMTGLKGMDYFATGINEHYNGEDLNQYLVDSEECKITPEIRNKVNSLVDGIDSIESKAEIIFNYVKDNIDYSSYEGSKYGANKTLSLGRGNSVDQTSLLISMFRTLDIPARYNFANNVLFYSGLMSSHCWAQVLIDNVWHIADTSSAYNIFGITYSCDLTKITNLKQGNIWNNMSNTAINTENISYNPFSYPNFSFDESYVFKNTHENSTSYLNTASYSSNMPQNTIISCQILSKNMDLHKSRLG